MSIMKEIWKDIPDYEGLYQASNLGSIRSVDSKITYKRRNSYVTRIRYGKILKPCNNRYGYPMVVLTKPNHRKCHSVHRLVMMAFFGKSELTVNHINGIKTDNRIENLEYATMSENLFHAHRTGLKNPPRVLKYTNHEIDTFKKILKKHDCRWYVAAKELNMKVKSLQHAIKSYDREWYDKNRPRSKKT